MLNSQEQELPMECSLFTRMFEDFPFPMQVLSLEGVSMWINRAMAEVFGLDPQTHVGTYHVFSDPFVQENHWEESIRQAMRGEATCLSDIQIDCRTYARILGDNKQQDTGLSHDINCFPIFDDNRCPLCVAVLFLIRKRYHGRDEIIQAKQYMDRHWHEPFHMDTLSKLVNLSPSHFHRLFRIQEGVTPYAYHLGVQIEKIKEQLMNFDMSIAEAFAACGIDYHGHYAKVFRQETGMTPSEFRERFRLETP